MYSEAIILLEQGIPEIQVPATMPQGKAIDVRDRQFVVRLKDYFDQERHQGLSVSTQDPAGRVAKALGIGKRTVKAILSTYQRRTNCRTGARIQRETSVSHQTRSGDGDSTTDS